MRLFLQIIGGIVVASFVVLALIYLALYLVAENFIGH